MLKNLKMLFLRGVQKEQQEESMKAQLYAQLKREHGELHMQLGMARSQIEEQQREIKQLKRYMSSFLEYVNAGDFRDEVCWSFLHARHHLERMLYWADIRDLSLERGVKRVKDSLHVIECRFHKLGISVDPGLIVYFKRIHDYLRMERKMWDEEEAIFSLFDETEQYIRHADFQVSEERVISIWELYKQLLSRRELMHETPKLLEKEIGTQAMPGFFGSSGYVRESYVEEYRDYMVRTYKGRKKYLYVIVCRDKNVLKFGVTDNEDRSRLTDHRQHLRNMFGREYQGDLKELLWLPTPNAYCLERYLKSMFYEHRCLNTESLEWLIWNEYTQAYFEGKKYKEDEGFMYLVHAE